MFSFQGQILQGCQVSFVYISFSLLPSSLVKTVKTRNTKHTSNIRELSIFLSVYFPSTFLSSPLTCLSPGRRWERWAVRNTHPGIKVHHSPLSSFHSPPFSTAFEFPVPKIFSQPKPWVPEGGGLGGKGGGRGDGSWVTWSKGKGWWKEGTGREAEGQEVRRLG